MAAGHSVEVDPARWRELFEEVMGRVAGRFGRVEPRRHARALVLGAAGGPAQEELLEARQVPSVLAVKATEPLTSSSGLPVPAARLAAQVPTEGWLRLSAGQGAKAAAGTGGPTCR